MAFDTLIDRMAEKWREVPGGSDQHPRRFSDELLRASDAELLAWALQPTLCRSTGARLERLSEPSARF